MLQQYTYPLCKNTNTRKQSHPQITDAKSAPTLPMVACMHACVYVCMYTFKFTQICMPDVYSPERELKYVYMDVKYIYIYTRIYIWMYTRTICIMHVYSPERALTYVCIYVCMYVHLNEALHTYVYMYACTFT